LLIANQVDEIISDRLQNTKKDKLAIYEFKKSLEEFSNEEGNIVFIIDELDRCRPDFALELIEQIKHLFSVKGIIFLLVMNRSQLEEAVMSRYGRGIEATLYLQKFVNLWFGLPRKKSAFIQGDDGGEYAKFVVDSMLDEGEEVNNSIAQKSLYELIKSLRPSFREIEQILSYFALINNMTGKSSYSRDCQMIIAFICYLKPSKPELINSIMSGNIDAESLLKESGISDRSPGNKILDELSNFIIYDLGDEDTRGMMISENKIHILPQYGVLKDVMEGVCGWLSNISTK